MAKEDVEVNELCIPTSVVLLNISIILIFFTILFFGALFTKQFKLVVVLIIQMMVLGVTGMQLFKF